MMNNFLIRKMGNTVVIENPVSPRIKAEVVFDSAYPGISRVSVPGICKISEIKRIIRRMEFYLEKHPEKLMKMKIYANIREGCFEL